MITDQPMVLQILPCNCYS